MVGGFEPDAKPWVAPTEMPYPFEFQLLDEDWEHFSILMESALKRIPALEQTGHPQVLQRARDLHARQPVPAGRGSRARGYFVGAGFNSVGIASAGGAGRALAEWVVEGEPSMDLRRSTSAASRRSTPTRPGCAAGWRRCSACTTPCRGPTASRRPPATSGSRRCTTVWPPPGRRSAPAMGWERPLLLRAGARLRLWGKPAWLEPSRPSSAPAGRRWRSSTRRRSASTSSTGRDALATLQWVCAADVDVAVGQAVYTPWLNARGTYESDVTVTRVGAEEFLVVSQRRDDGARPGLDRRARARGCRGRGRRPVRRPRRARRDGAALARAPGPADRRGPHRRRRSRSRPAGSSTWPARACAPPG